MRKAETTITLYIDPRSGQLPIDVMCIPTYEGGCPSRFCKPEGYDNHMGDGVKVDVTRFTYDGERICHPEHIMDKVAPTMTELNHAGNLNAIYNRTRNYGKSTT